MQGVNIKEARLLQQAINKNDFRYLTLEEHAIVDKAWKAMKESELYNKVGEDIENFANELVKEKCTPEWNRISAEMKPLGERANELEKEKAAVPADGEWENEKAVELEALNKQIADLADEYQKVTDQANAELNEYKEKRISEEEGAAFLLEDEEYELIGKLVGRALPNK